MYGGVVRSPGYQSDLCAFIHSAYGLEARTLTPAQRGYFGETWRLDAREGRYFLKLVYAEAHKARYARSFPVMAHMRRHGVTAISRALPTCAGELCAAYDTAVLGVFDWIDGENLQNQRTKRAEYRILGQVYAVPVADVPIARDTLGTQSADTFYTQWDQLAGGAPGEAARAVLAVLTAHRARLAHRAQRLALFARRCADDTAPACITHGDAGGNIIEQGDAHYLVDWDDPLLAPPERDAWFCLHWDWALAAFHSALRENGIAYTLRTERLAYYCYHSFFTYLTEYMQTFLERERADMAQALTDYFACWIEEEIAYADKLP